MASTMIFGLKADQHRVSVIRLFLKARETEARVLKANKDELLKTLSEIEHGMFREERAEATEWFMAAEEAHRLGQKLPRIAEDSRELELFLARNGDEFDSDYEARTVPSEITKKRQRAKDKEADDQSVIGDLDRPGVTRRNIQKKVKSERRESLEENAIRNRAPASYNGMGEDSIRSRSSNLGKIKECSICLEDYPKDEFLQTPLTTGCSHPLKACQHCVSMSIDTQITDVSWDQVKCPECPSTLPYDVVKRYASFEAFLIFDKKSLLAAFGAIHDFAMCLNPTCNSGQIHDGGSEKPVMTCDTCGYRMCFVHQTPWHEGKTCEEYDKERKVSNAQNRASERLIDKTAKICPGLKCGIPISKVEGCDHMTCKSCGHEFCFICRASWGKIILESNDGHEPHCKHHTSNLPLTRVHPAVRREAQALRRAMYESQRVNHVNNAHPEFGQLRPTSERNIPQGPASTPPRSDRSRNEQAQATQGDPNQGSRLRSAFRGRRPTDHGSSQRTSDYEQNQGSQTNTDPQAGVRNGPIEVNHNNATNSALERNDSTNPQTPTREPASRERIIIDLDTPPGAPRAQRYRFVNHPESRQNPRWRRLVSDESLEDIHRALSSRVVPTYSPKATDDSPQSGFVRRQPAVPESRLFEAQVTSSFPNHFASRGVHSQTPPTTALIQNSQTSQPDYIVRQRDIVYLD